MTFEKLTDELDKAVAHLRAEVVAVEESFRMEKARIKSIDRELATEVEKKQKLLTEYRDASQTASRSLVDGKESLPGLQSRLVSMTVKIDECFDLATETIETPNAAEADIALQSTLWKVAREGTDTQKEEIAELREQLTTSSAELSQLSESIAS